MEKMAQTAKRGAGERGLDWLYCILLERECFNFHIFSRIVGFLYQVAGGVLFVFGPTTQLCKVRLSSQLLSLFFPYQNGL